LNTIKDSLKAKDAYKKGFECDKELKTKDARLCLLKLCVLDVSHPDFLVNGVQWIEKAIENRDESILSLDGLACIQNCLENCRVSNNVYQGKRLLSLLELYAEGSIASLIENYSSFFCTIQESSINDSVSMDCSD